MTYNTEVDCTGQYVRINDQKGNTWFHGKAIERTGNGAYRFEVVTLARRHVVAVVVATVEELALAARRA